MLKIKDIMTKNVIYVTKDTPVIEAIRLMAKNDITGVPVVEDDMTPIGILSEQDVLRLYYTFEDEKDRTVNDFMTQPAIHFEVDEALLACLLHPWARKPSFLSWSTFSICPVVNIYC